MRAQASAATIVCVLSACGFAPQGAESIDAPGTSDANDASDGDLDDDGVADGTDNCPRVANPPPQRDHDGDGAGDPCDPCPHRPISDGGGDADGDGVGDVCDPRPGQHDRIARFEGFYDPPSGWTMTGTWDHDPAGLLRHASVVGAAEFAVMPDTLDQPYQVETSVVVDTVSTASNNPARQAGVAFSATDALDTFYLCSVRDDVGTAMPARTVIARFTQTDQIAENTSTNLANDLQAGSTFRVRAARGATEQSCLGTLEGTTAQPVLALAVEPGKRMALRTYGLGVRFDYVVIYQPTP